MSRPAGTTSTQEPEAAESPGAASLGLGLRRRLGDAGTDPALGTARAATLRALAGAWRGIDDRRSRSEPMGSLTLLRARLPDGHPAILRAVDGLCGIEANATPAGEPVAEPGYTR